MAGMNRRDFLRRAALVATGAIVADKLELLEMLAPWRLFPSIGLTEATFSFTQANARYQLNGYRTVGELAKIFKGSTSKLYEALARRVDEYEWRPEIESLYLTGHENLIPVVAWSNDYNEWNVGLEAELSSSVHELKTSVYPEWCAGPDLGRARSFRYPKEFARDEPRFVRQLRRLIERELPDPAIDPRSRPRFMREFDRLWDREL